MLDYINQDIEVSRTFLEDLLKVDSCNIVYDDFKISDLIDTNEIDWNCINKTFQVQRELFEKTLFSLHFKRKKKFDIWQKNIIIKFLCIGYVLTNDIRYFNEFLWFYTVGENEGYTKVCLSHFKSNLSDKNHHIAPFQRSEVHNFLNGYLATTSSNRANTALKVGLIGFPAFFSKISRELQKSGFIVEQFFIPYHPNKKINKVFANNFIAKTITLFSGNTPKYTKLTSDFKDENILHILSARGLDIGFHKLNFIIKKNIINAFSIGLINDHWGILPFLRGRSTIHYALIFGFPIVSTMHLIDEGIDTGKIVGFYNCDIHGIKKISGIRNKLRRTMPERAINAIKSLSSPYFQAIENHHLKGLTYYEIHPWLHEFIEKKILIENSG